MLMAGMLPSETPTIQQLAAAAGQSVRTFQRRLLDEGTAFSLLLDDVRHDPALKEIAARQVTLSSLSASLGYSRQAALTRAVRRWTGRTPTELRSARRN
jgi:AraC-like DNA-binding protein